MIAGGRRQIEAALQGWGDAMEAVQQELDALSQMLRQFGCDASAHADDGFSAMLASGNLSPAMHQYLAADLGEQVCKSLVFNEGLVL